MGEQKRKVAVTLRVPAMNVSHVELIANIVTIT